MKTVSKIAAFFAALAVSACVTPVTVVSAVDTDIRETLKPAETTVNFDSELSDYERLDQARLETALIEEFTESLTGADNPELVTLVDISIDILAYREPNAALAILISDTAQIVGNVVLTDPESGSTVGEYYIEVIEGAGGVLGLAAADTNEPELAREFVEKFMEFLMKDDV
ncbi:MAG: hypothetical protein AAGI14_00085 [Pseudomonadota bacterium]